MPPALTISEALKDESCWHFAGTHSDKGWTCAWVARRRGWGDDLLLQRASEAAVVVAARVKVAGPPVFAGDAFAVVVDGALKVCERYDDYEGLRTAVEPAKGETLRGSIRWVGDAFLVVVKRADGLECLRRYSWDRRGDFDEVYVASKGGSIGSFDGWPGSSAVALVHRLANAMIAEVIVVDEQGPRSVARDGRVEYAPPSLGCLVNDIPGTNGRRQLVCRFGGLDVASGVGAKLFADDAADAPQRLADGPTAGLQHGRTPRALPAAYQGSTRDRLQEQRALLSLLAGVSGALILPLSFDALLWKACEASPELSRLDAPLNPLNVDRAFRELDTAMKF